MNGFFCLKKVRVFKLPACYWSGTCILVCAPQQRGAQYFFRTSACFLADVLLHI